jgi:thymidylate kinase
VLSKGLLNAGSIVSAIDEALDGTVIVTGALPPEGRDLDLLVSDEQARRLAGILAARGFLARGRNVAPRRLASQQWVKIEGSSALAVDLNPMSRWQLPRPEQEALVAEAVPIVGFRHFARPSAHHVILIMARRLGAGTLSARRIEKLRTAVDQDPGAWQRAGERASAWGVASALPVLHRLYEGGAWPTRAERARAVLEVTRSAGLAGTAAKTARRLAAATPVRPQVIGFSGLDGSGKSSQVRALLSTLEQLDVAVVAHWKPLGHNASVRTIRRIVKRTYAAVRGWDAEQLDRSKQPGRSLVAGTDPALLGGKQNRLVTHVWATLVCLVSAGHYRMVALRHSGSGRLIVFDRFALDTTAQLRFFYGPEHEFGLQRALIRIICPTPIAAWLLEVPGEVALARKQEQYNLAQLKEQEGLLHEEAERLGVTRLDGTRPMAELSEYIATEVWQRMKQRPPASVIPPQ